MTMRNSTIRILIVLVCLIFKVAHISAQCDYAYKEADVISGKETYKTKDLKIAGVTKKKSVYVIQRINLHFEKTVDSDLIGITLIEPHTFGKAVMYNTQIDSLSIRFEDSTVLQLPLVLAKIGGVHRIKGFLMYGLNPVAKAKLRSSKVVALRIGGQAFDISLANIEADISEKFRTCYIE